MEKFRKGKKDNRGLTLVELICAIAILSILTTAVGSALVVSAKNYQRGSTEIDLQQEAQMTTNQIADLVIDSTSDISYSGGAPGVDKTMEIIKGDRAYVISFKAVDMKLTYSEYIVHADMSRTAVAVDQLMAEYVKEFSAEVSDFAKDGVMQLTLKFEKGDRNYASSYTVTARNGMASVSAGDAAATIVTESQIVLEPNEEYELSATVTGTADTTVHWNLSGNTDSATQILYDAGIGQWKLKVGTAETASELQLLVMTNAKREDGVTPLAQQAVQVLIRRVTGITLNVSLLEGTALNSGAKYQITASFSGSNLDKITGIPSDNNYIDPRKVDWTYLYTISGKEVGGEDWYGSPSSQAECYSILVEEDASLTLVLNRDMGNNEQLTITAVAKHPHGTEIGDASVQTNKTGIYYDHVYATYTFQKFLYSRSGDIMYRGTDVNQGSVDIGALQAITNAMYENNYWDQNNIWRKYRYREVITDPVTGTVSYGPWTNWLLTQAEAGSTFNIRPGDTHRFEPNKDYDVEFKFEAYKNGVVIFPVADTDPEVYSFIGRIDHAKLAFSFPELGVTGAYGVLEETPIAATCNVPYNITYQSTADNIVGIKFDLFQNNLQMKVEKLIDGTWTVVSDSDCKLEVQGNITQQHKVTFITPGTYRIVTGLKNIGYRTGSYNNPVDSTRDYWIGNESTGDGYYYFEVN